MLLIHQAGSVKVGEVVRYTLTYTPAHDRILPTPHALHVKIKNTCAIPFRAAWVHGPYALHVSAYPASFNPHQRLENPKRDGVPQYEPMLKAGGSWTAELLVPEEIRQTGMDLGKSRGPPSWDGGVNGAKGTATWIIEIASQILFSDSASVNFEVLVGRDERSLELGFAAIAGHGHGGPGQMKQKRSEKARLKAKKNGNLQTDGVYSKAVRLVAEDTEALWDKPPLPSWEDEQKETPKEREQCEDDKTEKPRRKRRKVHLVIITHGLHSNTGADMLFLKESIDATVAQARVDAKQRREKSKKTQDSMPQKDSEHVDSQDVLSDGETATAPLSGGQEDVNEADEHSEDEEQTVVRGFNGNAVRTENGIQYLGKRLAKYILRLTYPDQPYLPITKGFARTFTDTFKSEADKQKRDGIPAHSGSSIHQPAATSPEDLPYQFTSISFIGHSLGGLVQAYAIGYIQKHSPGFFEQIQPVNFVCMASPMLGLSNENPMYVKFALDFGLVGRTGQDLGLTWRPPTIAKTGWNAMIGGLGVGQKEQKNPEQNPGAKPLLRVLPTGPAHQVLKKFRNRSVYSNVVNDGIVPLRTSCLLFLDWRGLGRVDKARRENGLISTMAEWGWAELTGANLNSITSKNATARDMSSSDDENEYERKGGAEAVPQPDEDETTTDNKKLYTRASYDESTIPSSFTEDRSSSTSSKISKTAEAPPKGMFDNVLSFFRVGNSTPSEPTKPTYTTSKKTSKALRRGQTISHDDADSMNPESNPTMRPHILHSRSDDGKKRPRISKGDSYVDESTGELQAPPKTSIFESAGDILHPPLPNEQWIMDPDSRARTIFHDRVYRPEDIPPPPRKRTSTSRLFKSSSSDLTSQQSVPPSPASNRSAGSQDTNPDSSGMKVEEKIARAYHRDLTWRKVLVRLEPDAHNNMIVRRMFANAYGWPVVKHLCDTHFADTVQARTRDDDEPNIDRAETQPVSNTDDEVEDQTPSESRPETVRSQSEIMEAEDEVRDLGTSQSGASGSHSSNRPASSRHSSIGWDDTLFESSDGDDESDVDERFFVQKFINPNTPRKPETSYQPPRTPTTSQPAPPQSPSSPHYFLDGHRGLSPTTSRSPGNPLHSPASLRSTFESAGVESPIIANKLVQEPEALETGRRASTAAMGLRKSVQEQMGPTKSNGR